MSCNRNHTAWSQDSAKNRVNQHLRWLRPKAARTTSITVKSSFKCAKFSTLILMLFSKGKIRKLTNDLGDYKIF